MRILAADKCRLPELAAIFVGSHRSLVVLLPLARLYFGKTALVFAIESLRVPCGLLPGAILPNLVAVLQRHPAANAAVLLKHE